MAHRWGQGAKWSVSLPEGCGLQCIGATTLEEYQRHIKQDPAQARRYHARMWLWGRGRRIVPAPRIFAAQALVGKCAGDCFLAVRTCAC